MKPTPSIWRRLLALLRQRCPRCCQGKIFRNRFELQDPCSVCGLIFQREEGYFLGAMYASYLISSLLLCGGFFIGRELLPGWKDLYIVALVFVLYLPLVPSVYRYSRTLWIHFDRWIAPTDVSAQAFEKARANEFRSRHDGGE